MDQDAIKPHHPITLEDGKNLLKELMTSKRSIVHLPTEQQKMPPQAQNVQQKTNSYNTTCIKYQDLTNDSKLPIVIMSCFFKS